MSLLSETIKKASKSILSSQKDKKIGNYLIKETIGKGTFSKVCIGHHLLTKEKVAIKIMQKNKIKDRVDIERINREISILKTTNHPNISQLYETLSTSNNYYLIMEYVSGGDLFDFILRKSRLSEAQACFFFRQIIASVEYLHKQEIIHRDIKPENILLDEERKMIKVIDFGLSNICGKNEVLKSSCGSPCYASPEMISGKEYKGEGIDIWSCGVVLYCMLYGVLPFDEDDLMVLYNKIKLGVFLMPKTISEPSRDLIAKMLKVNPKLRITIEEIKKHSWFKIETNALHKGIFPYYESIQVDRAIVSEIKQSFFKEDLLVTETAIYQSVQGYKCNKYSATYYLHIKSKGYQINPTPLTKQIIKPSKKASKTRNDIVLRKSSNYNVFVINNIFQLSHEKSSNQSPTLFKPLRKRGATQPSHPTQPSDKEKAHFKDKSSLSSLSISLSRSLNKTTTPIKKHPRSILDTSIDVELRLRQNQRKKIEKYIRNKGNHLLPMRNLSKNNSLNSKYLILSPKNQSVELSTSCHKRNKSENCTGAQLNLRTIKERGNDSQLKRNNLRPARPQFPTSMNASQEKKMKKETIITLILKKCKDKSKDKEKETISSNNTVTFNQHTTNIKVIHQSNQLSPFSSKSQLKWQSTSQSKSKSRSKSKSSNSNNHVKSPFKYKFPSLASKQGNKDIIKAVLLQKVFLPPQ